jgi:hypothetical protein
MASTRTHRNRRTDAGVTVVEYALVLSLLAGGSMVALDAMAAPAVSAVQRQAICAAQRPAPPQCHQATVVQP